LKSRTLTGALVGALLLLAVPSSAFASHEDTLMNLDFSTNAKSRNAGTKANPNPVNLNIDMTQSTRSGTGQPETSTDLNITLPKQFRFNGKIWPKRLRCDPRKANQRRSDSACPRSSKIGDGHVTATGGDGAFVEEIDVRAYVTTGGDLGLWLSATAPLPINEMLVGEVSRGRKIEVGIPSNIQAPLTGVKSSIRKLEFGLNKNARIGGEARGVVESIGCGSGRRWTLAFQNVYQHGSTTDSDTAACRA
jgi:hypothetical protein